MPAQPQSMRASPHPARNDWFVELGVAQSRIPHSRSSLSSEPPRGGTTASLRNARWGNVEQHPSFHAMPPPQVAHERHGAGGRGERAEPSAADISLTAGASDRIGLG